MFGSLEDIDAIFGLKDNVNWALVWELMLHTLSLALPHTLTWLLKILSKSDENKSVPNKIMNIYISNKIDNKFIHLSVYMILRKLIYKIRKS